MRGRCVAVGFVGQQRRTTCRGKEHGIASGLCRSLAPRHPQARPPSAGLVGCLAPMTVAREQRSGSDDAAFLPAAVISLNEPLLDVQAAAELLNVKVSWIREATRTGLLPCIKVGRHVRWTRPMLERWLAGQQTGV